MFGPFDAFDLDGDGELDCAEMAFMNEVLFLDEDEEEEDDEDFNEDDLEFDDDEDWDDDDEDDED